MARAAFPLLLRVTPRAVEVWPTGWLPKPIEAGFTLATGPVATPTPLNVAILGLPGALSLMVSAPLRGPLACGVKVTWMVQLPPAGKELPHPLLSAKSPVAEIPLRTKTALPELLRVSALATEVWPTS